MKKAVFIPLLFLFGFSGLKAQNNQFGFVGGFHNQFANVNVNVDVDFPGGDNVNESISDSDGGAGIYLGGFGEFGLSEKINLYTEIQFAFASSDGNTNTQIMIPILAKYYINEKFSIVGGPQLDFMLTDSDFINTFGIGIGIGAGYNLSERFTISGRYSFGLNNRIKNLETNINTDNFSAGYSLKYSYLQIGVAYRLGK